jgi:haloalkane dehalogenase
VPDHIGMGLSEKPAAYRYTLEQRVNDVLALVETLGLRRLDLVVHDWGGAIGLGLLARRPELLGRVVLLNTAAFPSTNIPRRIALCRTRFPGTLLVRGCNGFAGPAVVMAMARRALSDDERRGYLWPYRTWADRVAVDAFVKDIPLETSHRSHAALLAAEQGIELLRGRAVLIAWGGRDFCFDDSFYAEWRRRLPESDAVYLADAGHYVLEDARDELLPRLARFLKR